MHIVLVLRLNESKVVYMYSYSGQSTSTSTCTHRGGSCWELRGNRTAFHVGSFPCDCALTSASVTLSVQRSDRREGSGPGRRAEPNPPNMNSRLSFGSHTNEWPTRAITSCIERDTCATCRPDASRTVTTGIKKMCRSGVIGTCCSLFRQVRNSEK